MSEQAGAGQSARCEFVDASLPPEIVETLSSALVGCNSRAHVRSVFDGAARGRQGYDPMQPRDERGRWANGATFSSGISSSSEDVGEPSPWPKGVGARGTGGAFEEIHWWKGPGLPKPESPALQKAKAEAFNEVLPHAKEGAKHEAISVILRNSGQRLETALGGETQVTHFIPPEPVVVVHSHPKEIAHSNDDWARLITNPYIVQSHVVAPMSTFSLHKPTGWVKPKGVTTRQVLRDYADAKREIEAKAKKFGVEPTVSQRRAAIEDALALKYGIIRRVGRRSSRG